MFLALAYLEGLDPEAKLFGVSFGRAACSTLNLIEEHAPGMESIPRVMYRGLRAKRR